MKSDVSIELSAKNKKQNKKVSKMIVLTLSVLAMIFSDCMMKLK